MLKFSNSDIIIIIVITFIHAKVQYSQTHFYPLMPTVRLKAFKRAANLSQKYWKNKWDANGLTKVRNTRIYSAFKNIIRYDSILDYYAFVILMIMPLFCDLVIIPTGNN